MKVPRLISKENKQADAGRHLFSEVLSVRRVVVERVDAHGLLRGGVGRKYRVIQGFNVNVQYSFDEYIPGACVMMHAHGRLRRVQRSMCAYVRAGELAVQ